MQINEAKLRLLIRDMILNEAKSDYKKFKPTLSKGAMKKIQSISKKTLINTGHNATQNIGVIVTSEASVKRIFNNLKAEKYGIFGGDKKAKDFISKIEAAVKSAGRKMIKFREAGIGIHDGVQIEERLIIMLNAGMIPSASIMAKAKKLEPKYAEVKVGNKTITRTRFGNTEVERGKLPMPSVDKKGGDSAKPKKKKKKYSSKVAKIQEIIGAKPDGIWGSKTSAKWKSWIVSDEAAKGIKEMGMDDVLTKDYLEANKGNALAIAEKAGYDTGSALNKVLKLAETISTGSIDLGQEEQKPQEKTSKPKPKIKVISLDPQAQDKASEAIKGLTNVASMQFNLEGTVKGKEYDNVVVRADGQGITFRKGTQIVGSQIVNNDPSKALEWALWFNRYGKTYL